MEENGDLELDTKERGKRPLVLGVTTMETESLPQRQVSLKNKIAQPLDTNPQEINLTSKHSLSPNLGENLEWNHQSHASRPLSNMGEPADDKAGTFNELEVSSDEPCSEDEQNYAGGVRMIILTIGLMLATFTVALDNAILSTAIPRITSDFDSLDDVGCIPQNWSNSDSTMKSIYVTGQLVYGLDFDTKYIGRPPGTGRGLYGSSYLLTTTALQPSFGKVYAYYNIKWTFLLAVTIFEIGSLVCATAPNSIALILGRIVAGVGASAIFSGAITIVGYTVPLRSRALYIAMLTSMFGVSSIVGPLIGGAFTDRLSWRYCFWINLPIGAVSILSTLIFFHNPERQHSNRNAKQKLKEIDILGALLLISSIVCLLLALQWGGTTHPWSDSRVWGCLLGFGCIIGAFVIVQIKLGERATIPPRVVTQRTVYCSCLFTMLVSMGLYTHIYYLPFYFQAVKGTSAEDSGIRTIPYLVSNTLATIISGGLINLVGWYNPFMWIGSALFAVGSALLYLLKVETSTARWIGYELVAGASAGLAFQVPVVAVQTVLLQQDIPVGSALVIFSISLGGALAVSIAQSIFSNILEHELVRLIPQMDPSVVTNAGATHFRAVTPSALLPLVLQAYNTALTKAYILSVGASAAAFFCSLGMELRSVKKKSTGNIPK